MAKPRQKDSGKWEITLRHPLLPKGRKAFTFDSEADAAAYGEQWALMKGAGLPPPAELLNDGRSTGPLLDTLLADWLDSGLAAPTQHIVLKSLRREVGNVKLSDVNYTWLSAYLQRLKVEVNLAPNSIRHRIQALGRAIDEHLRHNSKVVMQNPVKLLPRGYSTYTEKDQKLIQAAELANPSGKRVKEDVIRDRRLHPGEEEKIVQVLSGKVKDGAERGLQLLGGNALLTMFLVIVYSGLRLREAYTLKRGQVDLPNWVLRVQSSKQKRGKIVFRDVPIRPEAYQALTKYLSTRSLLPTANLFPFIEEEPGMTLKKVTQRLSDRFASAFNYSGCKDLHEHDLRHEATCRWLELRDSMGNWMFRLEEVNKIMGWSANSTMAQRYASFRGSDLAQRMWATAAPQHALAAGAASGAFAASA